MFNVKSLRKGEIATLLTLGLVIVGAVITIGSSFFINKTKNLASNPRASDSCLSGSSCYLLASCPTGMSLDTSKTLCYIDDKLGRCCKTINNTPIPTTTKPPVPTSTPTVSKCSDFGACYFNSYTCERGYGQKDCPVGYKCGAHCSASTPSPTTPINIPTPTKSSTPTCPYSCEKYSCSFGYKRNTNYSCSGIDMVCCQKSSIIPTNIPTPTKSSTIPTLPPQIPTPTSDSCEYLNFTECRDDCSGSCSRCINGRYKCVARVIIPTPTKSDDDLFNKDCRCINGIWSGGGCDGWQRGKSCLPAGLPQCKKNSQRCTNASDTSCCSGYCVPSPYGYYCQSVADVAKGCTSLTTKCDGNYLMKCINGVWVKEKLCSSCQTSLLGGVQCVETGMGGTVQTSSTINGSSCTTRDDWSGTCTLSSNCNSIKSGIAWDSNAAECKSSGSLFGRGGVLSYGCCGVKPNDDCFQKGSVQVKGDKCFACYLTDKTPGKMIEVSPSLCQKVTSGEIASVNPFDIQLNAVSTEDQYLLRQNAFDIFESTHDAHVVVKGAAWIMEQADSLTYYTFGQLPKIFGGEATSSMGNYYVAQMEANAAAAAEGKTRKVTVGQALTTGVIGGYQYANLMLFGLPNAALNLASGGKTENWEANTLTVLYGANESAAALKTIEAGSDLTNIVAILIPVGKGLSAAGGKMTTTAAKLEQAGQAGFRSAILRGSGRITSVSGAGFQIISPETWASGFIKSAPVTTFLEQTSATVSRLRPVVATSTRVTKVAASITEGLTTAFPKTAQVVRTVGRTTTTVGKKVVDVFLPRSALSYTPDEVARYLVRDINIGIIQPDDAARRLATRYRQSFINSNQITNFTDRLMGTGVDEQVTTQVKNNLLINLQEQLAKRAQRVTFGERLVNLIQPDQGEVKVIGDFHSDVSTSQKMLANLGFIDPKTGKAKNVFGVILGDYFGKTSKTLVEESATPGLDVLRNAISLQEQTGGKIVALAGNWEPRAAYATRLQKLSQLTNEAISQGDEAYARALLEDNGYKSLQGLDDEIRNFLKLDKPITGQMPLSHAEIDFLANNNEEVGKLMGKLKVITRMPDGSVFQHIDDAELLRYVFNSTDEIEVLALSSQTKAVLEDIVSSRGNSQTYLSADQVRELNLVFKQLGWGGDAVMEKINQNTARILEDGLTQLNSPAAKKNLLDLEKDMGKDLAFYQTPDVLVEFSNIFSQNGDLRLVHGHSPIDTIQALLGNNPQSGFVELADGVYTLADNPNISIYDADVNISRGMRIRGPNNAFLEVINGLMQVTDETVLSPALPGPSRIVTNPYDPVYLLYQKFGKFRKYWLLRFED